MVLPTQPLMMDMNVNYEIESDEELEEQGAEDCESGAEVDEETEPLSSDDGFIVPDGHLSENEDEIERVGASQTH